MIETGVRDADGDGLDGLDGPDVAEGTEDDD